MLIVTIILGLVGLGLVVVVHEFGHFLAARAVGVEVEAFSIGWGPRIAGFKRGATEWRLSAFPIGGYCQMKGEESFRKALAEEASEMPRESGSFYGASPWRRIVDLPLGPSGQRPARSGHLRSRLDHQLLDADLSQQDRASQRVQPRLSAPSLLSRRQGRPQVGRPHRRGRRQDRQRLLATSSNA